jgi:hypothetical protein
MKTLLYIRRMQFQDFIMHSSIKKRLELLILVATVLVLLSFSLLHANYIFYSIPILVCLFVQLFRKDYILLKKTGIALHKICSIEYLALSIPFIITAIFQKRFEYAFISIIFLFLLPIITLKTKKYFSKKVYK